MHGLVEGKMLISAKVRLMKITHSHSPHEVRVAGSRGKPATQFRRCQPGISLAYFEHSASDGVTVAVIGVTDHIEYNGAVIR